MINEEIDYTWTRPEMRACVESRLHDLIVQPDGLSDDELISMIKKQLYPQPFIPMGLLSQHVHDEWEKKKLRQYPMIPYEKWCAMSFSITLLISCLSVDPIIPVAFLILPLALFAVHDIVYTFARFCTRVYYFACSREVATEPEACEVLRERLQGLAEGVKEEGNEAVADQVTRLANSNFSSFSGICFNSSTSLIKGVDPSLGQAGGCGGGGGGGGGDDIVLNLGTVNESSPLLGKPESESREKACCIM